MVTCPVLIIHGQSDTFIPIQHSVKLFEALIQERSDDTVQEDLRPNEYWRQRNHDNTLQMVEFLNGEHNDLHQMEGCWEIIRDFINNN